MLDTIQKKENLAIHNYIYAKLRHQYCNTFAGAVADKTQCQKQVVNKKYSMFITQLSIARIHVTTRD